MTSSAGSDVLAAANSATLMWMVRCNPSTGALEFGVWKQKIGRKAQIGPCLGATEPKSGVFSKSNWLTAFAPQWRLTANHWQPEASDAA
ncbi:hypothetical protein [Rhizobium sp. RAF56]|uniref:hypothetical protein n=1 Tax=Rhizobium sp. RAF56 TaxID=3233062 RepID=UPI003F9DECD7